jgi:hypothetical protein
MSRTTTPTTGLPIAGPSRNGKAGLWLHFGKYRVPLAAHEMAALEARLSDHMATTGTNYGLVASILGLADRV